MYKDFKSYFLTYHFNSEPGSFVACVAAGQWLTNGLDKWIRLSAAQATVSLF